MKSKITERHCEIELLRIIAMIMVFSLHFLLMVSIQNLKI